MSSLTTTDGLKAYLAAKSWPFSTVEELSGGNANYVWRIAAQDGATSIAKHAEPFVKFNVDFSLPAERMDFEAQGMATIGDLLSDLKPDLCVGPAEVKSYDSEQHVLIMSDGRGQNLKVLYKDLSTEQVRSIGRRLGHWLAELHKRSTAAGTSIGEGGNPIAKSVYRYSYQGLQGVLAQYGLGGPDGELGKQVDEKYGPMFLTDDTCVCQGDFWTGNVILNRDDVNEPKIHLTLVDFEMVRRGVAATDVAQFTAEAHLLDRFSPVSHGLAVAFLESYLSNTTLAEDFWERFMIHWATHVIFWPTFVRWASDEEQKRLAEIGVEVIRSSINGDKHVIDEFKNTFMEELRRAATAA